MGVQRAHWLHAKKNQCHIALQWASTAGSEVVNFQPRNYYNLRRTRSSRVRDPWLGHQVAASAHPAVRRTGGGGHERDLPAGREKMLHVQARMVHCNKWVGKHECEELKEGVWLVPLQAMLRRKTNEEWRDKHRHVTKKLAGRGRRMGAEKIVRVLLVRRKEVSRM